MPHIGFAESFGREHPVEEDVSLLIVAIGVDLDITASRRDPLDLAHGLDTRLIVKVMDDVDANRRVDAAARERQSLRTRAYDAAADTGVTVLDRVPGNFKPPHIETGHNRHQIAHEEALGAAYVQHAAARPEPKMRGNVASHRDPASIIAVAAVPLLSRAIKIFAAESAGHGPVFRLPLFARGKIALCTRIFCQKVNLRHWRGPSCRRALPPSPRRAT